tara:strand:- start:1120 stop:1434 length:315 start_codon:yes stop_codon:yes gene_type:complete
MIHPSNPFGIADREFEAIHGVEDPNGGEPFGFLDFVLISEGDGSEIAIAQGLLETLTTEASEKSHRDFVVHRGWLQVEDLFDVFDGVEVEDREVPANPFGVVAD